MATMSKEYSREAQRKWKKALIADPERFDLWKAKVKKQRKSQPWSKSEKTKLRCKKDGQKASKKTVEKMTDKYIAYLLRVEKSEIPKELLQIKRATLTLKRIVKGIKNNDKSRKTH